MAGRLSALLMSAAVKCTKRAPAREVIVSAGAVGSPHLLQLSGIGPAALLKRHGIAVVQDNKAVGRHLKDHLCYDFTYRSRAPSLNNALRPWHGKLRAGLQYVVMRSGPAFHEPQPGRRLLPL